MDLPGESASFRLVCHALRSLRMQVVTEPYPVKKMQKPVGKKNYKDLEGKKCTRTMYKSIHNNFSTETMYLITYIVTTSDFPRTHRYIMCK